jgi:hypothetical protein
MYTTHIWLELLDTEVCKFQQLTVPYRYLTRHSWTGQSNISCLPKRPEPTHFQVREVSNLLRSRWCLEMLEGVQPRLGQLSHRGRQLRALAQIQEQVEQAFQILRS